MTWLDVFDRLAVVHGDAISIEDEQAMSGAAGDVLEALLDRYREEGYPGMNAELPADLLIQ
jgi:hypothetical protein